MANTWKGPGVLLLKGSRVIRPGNLIPDGALTPERLIALGDMIAVDAPSRPSPFPLPLPVPQTAIPVSNPVTQGLKRGFRPGPKR
jgi:hypothetical protein